MKNRVECFVLAAVLAGGYFIAYAGSTSSKYNITTYLLIYALFIICCGYLGNNIYNYHLKKNKENSPFKNWLFLFGGIILILLIAIFINRIMF